MNIFFSIQSKPKKNTKTAHTEKNKLKKKLRKICPYVSHFLLCSPVAPAVITTTLNAFDAERARTHTPHNMHCNRLLFVFYTYRVKIAAHDMFHIN